MKRKKKQGRQVNFERVGFLKFRQVLCERYWLVRTSVAVYLHSIFFFLVHSGLRRQASNLKNNDILIFNAFGSILT